MGTGTVFEEEAEVLLFFACFCFVPFQFQLVVVCFFVLIVPDKHEALFGNVASIR